MIGLTQKEDMISMGDDTMKNYFSSKTTKKYTRRMNKFLGYGRANSEIVQGLHKQSKKQVAIKIIPKRDRTLTEIDKMREVIKMY